MIIIIRTKNFDLSDDIRAYINKKFVALEKFIKTCRVEESSGKMKSSCELFIDVIKETKHHRKGYIFTAKANIHLPHINITADAGADSVPNVIDRLKEEFLDEAKKYKSKIVDESRKDQRRFKNKLKGIK